MTDIDELRRTLDDHANDAAGLDVVSRTTAVHDRIGVVRRRRRAAVAGGAAAVLAVAAGVALLPDSGSPDPANSRVVVGVEAPAQMSSLDYTYAFDRVVEGDGSRAVVTLESSDEPRLVSWATSGDTDRVRLESEGEDPMINASADFTDFVLVPPGADGQVRVVATEGRVGLAVYELTDDRPEGITEEGVTFRHRVENRTLIDATVGPLGDSDVSLDVTTPAGGVAYAVYCAGAPDEALLRVSHGEGYFESGCGNDVFDPGLNAAEVEDQPASDEPVRAWIVDRRGQPVDGPGIRLGIGVYAVDPEPSAGQSVPSVLEYDGHRWRFDQMTEAAPGTRTISARATGVGQQLVVLLASGPFESARPVIEGIEMTWLGLEVRTPTRWEIGQAPEGGRISVSLHGSLADDARLSLATYERAD